MLATTAPVQKIASRVWGRTLWRKNIERLFWVTFCYAASRPTQKFCEEN